MLVYPQLGSGALSQFPVQKRRRVRTIVNTAADGSSIRLADPGAEATEWRLSYSDLSDEEAAALEQFFRAAEGTLNGFTFVDPMANLFAWSEALDNEVWARDPLLCVTRAAKGWRLSNSGMTTQGLSQTLNAPPSYVYCVSAYVRSPQQAPVTMLLDANRAERATTTDWTRITLTGSGEADAESIRFGIEIPAGAELDVFGMQVEPQTGASVYKVSTTGGVYENSRLTDDVLAVTAIGVNRHSCTVNIIHVKHL